MNKAFLFLQFLILSSCSNFDSDCFKSNKNESTEIRSIDSFTEISVLSVISVEWKESNNYSVDVVGGSRLLPKILTTVKDSCLIIENTNSCNWVRNPGKKIKVIIYSPSLKKISLNTSCDFISNDTLKNTNLTIDNKAGISQVKAIINVDLLNYWIHSGTGSHEISGKAKQANLYSNGNSYLFCKQLITEVCNISSISTGKSFVSSNNQLNVSIMSSGSVYYSGNPIQVTLNKEGDGKLIKE